MPIKTCWPKCSKIKTFLRDLSICVAGRGGCFVTDVTSLIRQRKYQVALLDDSILDLVDAEFERRGTADIPLRADALHDCLEALSEKSRQTIRMRYFEGLHGNRVAERLGRKPDAVYKALQRIYVTLAQCIRKKMAALDTGDSIS